MKKEAGINFSGLILGRAGIHKDGQKMSTEPPRVPRVPPVSPHSPSKRGQILRQAVTPPWLVYCPSAVSRKKTGIPQVKRKMR